MPLIFLILPFFIIKLQGKELSLEKYIEVLKLAFSNHQFGQMFQLQSMSWDKRAYSILSFCFYVFQIYQNVNACIQFYTNIDVIHRHLFEVRDYLDNTSQIMASFINNTTQFKSYKPFIDNLESHLTILRELKNEIDEISPYTLSFKKSQELGVILKCYYRLNINTSYIQSLDYSYKFIGYYGNICQVKNMIKSKTMNYCKFTKKPTQFIGAYYPHTKDPIKNSYSLENRILITGPNAAGKTTLLKTTLLNIILSQQLGIGFYKKAQLNVYDQLYSYINIPDTSGRDSLFQAEARRCKHILDSIYQNKTKRHFCIFDELFSGTNPHEAIGSAIAFLKHLNEVNADYIITTHFLNICNQLEIEQMNKNYHMNVNIKNDSFEYTYKLKPGISSIKGGVQVLQDLNFPESIIKMTNSYINKINTLN